MYYCKNKEQWCNDNEKCQNEQLTPTKVNTSYTTMKIMTMNNMHYDNEHWTIHQKTKRNGQQLQLMQHFKQSKIMKYSTMNTVHTAQ